MTEYGEGYVLKESLIILTEWDNDIEKWVILDDDLEFLMTEKNDVVPVVRCKDCKYAEETYRPDIVRCTNFSTYHDPWKVWRGWYCGDGERRDGGESDAD